MQRSYTSVPGAAFHSLRDAARLYRRHSMNLEERIRGLVVETGDAVSKLEVLYGRELRGCRILDVGPGPFLLQAYVLGLKNEVTAIDLDVIPMGLSPMAYLRLLW